MKQPRKQPEYRPINEEAAVSNEEFIAAVESAKQGPVMTSDEFKAWLNRS